MVPYDQNMNKQGTTGKTKDIPLTIPQKPEIIRKLVSGDRWREVWLFTVIYGIK